MKKSIIALCITVLGLSSCTTVKYTTTIDTVDSQVHNLTVADLNVKEEKVTHSYSWEWNPLSTVSLEERKKSAAAELLIEQGADVLVEPQYVVTKHGLFSGGTIMVSGYPATYSNFHTMTNEEAKNIATLDGKMAPTSVITRPLFSDTKTTKIKTPKQKKPKINYEEKFSKKFVNIILGGGSGEYSDGGDFSFVGGVMYGQYWRNWGYYTKLTLSTFEDCEFGEEWKFSVGAIKTISSNVNVFAGLGFGHCHEAERLPIEIGFQWRIKHFNVLVGASYDIIFKDYTDDRTHIFAGIGYCF